MIQSTDTNSSNEQCESSSGDAHSEQDPCIWGLSPQQLHDAYWHSRGIQPVRRGRQVKLQRQAELYLLIEPDQLVLFDTAKLIDRLSWRNAVVTRILLTDKGSQYYSEHVIVNDEGQVQRIERRYRPRLHSSHRIIVTPSRRIAALWCEAQNVRQGWVRIRRSVSWPRIDHWRHHGIAFAADYPDQIGKFLDCLVEKWDDPSRAIEGIQRTDDGVWRLAGDVQASATVHIGPLWMGCGDISTAGKRCCLVGPAWIADDPDLPNSSMPSVFVRDICDVQFNESPAPKRMPQKRIAYRAIKRAIDVSFSAIVLTVLSPLFGIIALLIWLEDSGPVFFSHRRLGRGGSVFMCMKFRTMQVDSHCIARDLESYNLCDGPQVYIKDDPRVTRIGKLLRHTHLDEFPQFYNVLCGEMSIVGPRPSPDDENQFCPAWRDVRLSVRPGITGLWQLKRRREPGEDFQEWIKYDIEYVQHANLLMDLSIALQTALIILTGRKDNAPA